MMSTGSAESLGRVGKEARQPDGAAGVEQAGALRQRVLAGAHLRGVSAGWPSPRSASARGLASSISATVPATTGAAMLVPVRLRYGLNGVGRVPSSR